MTCVEKITQILDNRLLAESIDHSIALALQHPFVHLVDVDNVWSVFEQSLGAAIRDIVNHPRGKLFQRLIRFGPHNPEHPNVLSSNSETILSDPECGECVEFIYSHMINRFKGELAELLALMIQSKIA